MRRQLIALVLPALLAGAVVCCNSQDAAAQVAEGRHHQPLQSHSPGFQIGFQPQMLDHVFVGGTWSDRGLGFDRSYFTVGAVQGVYVDKLDGWWFVEGRAHASDEGGFFSNIGLGRRIYFEPEKADIGLSVWYDYDDDRPEMFGHVFHQMGISADFRTENWDFLINGYIPLGSHEFLEDINCFQGNQIIVPAIDSALSGWEVMWIGRPEKLALVNGRIKLGAYNYRSDLVDGFGGFKIGFGMQPHQGVDLNFEMNNDSVFGTSGMIQVAFHFGADRDFSPSNRGLEPTQRNDHVVRFHRDTFVALNPATGAPWEVWHVDNAAGGLDNGTAEDPFDTIQEAENAAGPNDMIFVREGIATYADPNGVVLQDGQYLLGDGVQHIIPVSGGPISSFELCNDQDGLRPTIQNSTAADNQVIELANDNVVAGFIVDGNNDEAFGISANGVDNALIQLNEFNNTTVADIAQGNTTGTFTINNNVFNVGGTNAIFVATHSGPLNITGTTTVITGGTGNAIDIGSLTGPLTITGITIDAAGLNALEVGASNTNMRIEDVTVTNPTLNGFNFQTVGNQIVMDNITMDGGGAGLNAINMDTVTGLFQLTDSNFNNFAGSGVVATNHTATTTVDGTTITNMGIDGISFTGASNNTVITNNTIDTTIAGDAIFLDGLANVVTLRGNDIDNAGANGIFSDNSTANFTVRNNSVNVTGLDALHFEDSTGSYTLSDNSIADAGDQGMSFERLANSGVSITRSVVDNSATQGIHFLDSTGTGNVTFATITNNGTGGQFAGVHFELNGVTGDTFSGSVQESFIDANGEGVYAESNGPAAAVGGPTVSVIVSSNLAADLNGITNSENDGIRGVVDNGGTLNLRVTENDILFSGAGGSGSGIEVNANGVAASGRSRLDLTINENVLLDAAGDLVTSTSGIYIGGMGNSNSTVLMEDNIITNAGVQNDGVDNGITLDFNVTDTTQSVNTVEMNRNTVSNHGIEPVNLFFDSNLNVLVAGDDTRLLIDANANAFNAGDRGINGTTADASVTQASFVGGSASGSLDDNIRWDTFDTSRTILAVEDNTIDGSQTEDGIQTDANDTSVLVTDIFNNNMDLNSDVAIFQNVFDSGRLFSLIRDNDITNTGGGVFVAIEIDLNAGSTPAALICTEVTGNSADSSALFQNFTVAPAAATYDADVRGNFFTAPFETFNGQINQNGVDCELDSQPFRVFP